MLHNFRRILSFITFNIILIIICNLSYNYTSQKNIEEKKEILRGLSNTIHSIDINDTVYNDISFLDDILQDKRIVLLGEQTHSDGTVFEAKSRIIRYLHEKLGYNVVLYESGLYDVWFMENQEELNPLWGVFSFWWSNKECETRKNLL